eukprot:802095-Pelagomonas_calceolata.AAC.1
MHPSYLGGLPRSCTTASAHVEHVQLFWHVYSTTHMYSTMHACMRTGSFAMDNYHSCYERSRLRTIGCTVSIYGVGKIRVSSPYLAYPVLRSPCIAVASPWSCATTCTVCARINLCNRVCAPHDLAPPHERWLPHDTAPPHEWWLPHDTAPPPALHSAESCRWGGVQRRAVPSVEGWAQHTGQGACIMCVCVRVYVCMRVRACARARVCVFVCVCMCDIAHHWQVGTRNVVDQGTLISQMDASCGAIHEA